MKKSATFKPVAVLLLLLSVSVLMVFAACNNEPTVSKIEMATQPSVTEYKVGDTFSAAGGKIKVIYSDDSSKEIALTADGVSLSSIDMSSPGTKAVTVSYGGKSTTFTITVSDGSGPKPNVTVARITVKALPTKTEYFVGDDVTSVTYEGGVLALKYSDGTDGEVDFTDEDVTFSTLSSSTSGAKSITIYYEGLDTTMTIYIVEVGGVVTFDHNFPGGHKTEVRVARNRGVVQPENPTRENHTFYKWYSDAACTIEYSFVTSNIIAGDRTIYAYWKDNSESYCEVVYDYNFYGRAPSQYAQIVKTGDSARAIADPARSEFSFDGWFTDESLTLKYNGGAISRNTILRAKWNKTKSGVSTYTFEAEDTDLSGKSGPGHSGTNTGAEMIVEDTNLGASQNMFVSYLYKKGNSLEFRFASSESVVDATVAISMAAELPNIDLNSTNYLIKINGVNQSYPSISLENGGRFEDAVVLTGITLAKGYNIIELITNNDVNPTGAGTYDGTAPMIDCIKITTSAVLMWDGNYSLPMKGNY